MNMIQNCWAKKNFLRIRAVFHSISGGSHLRFFEYRNKLLARRTAEDGGQRVDLVSYRTRIVQRGTGQDFSFISLKVISCTIYA